MQRRRETPADEVGTTQRLDRGRDAQRETPLTADDVALDAALVARATQGRPVKLQWMREDDMAHDFFRAGGGCRNSAEATIVAHEYGHFVDHAFGGITNSGLSEGWGDTLACLLYRAPVVGGDLFDSGRALRTCDNAYRYPAGGVDDHATVRDRRCRRPRATAEGWLGAIVQGRRPDGCARRTKKARGAPYEEGAPPPIRSPGPRRCARPGRPPR